MLAILLLLLLLQQVTLALLREPNTLYARRDEADEDAELYDISFLAHASSSLYAM